MIDMVKQIIIKYKLTSLDQILMFFAKYFQGYVSDSTDPKDFYKHYQLKYPSKKWIKECTINKIII